MSVRFLSIVLSVCCSLSLSAQSVRSIKNIGIGINHRSSDSALVTHAQVGLVSSVDSLKGIQAGLLSSVTWRKMSGLSIGGFHTLNVGKASGVQAAVNGNFSIGGMKGLQASFVTNTAHRLSGVQLAGFTNIMTAPGHAIQIAGVTNVAIGDLGNEVGMGTIGAHIKKYVPFTAPGECQCGCGGGILAASCADNIITATCSDWGCYALMAALAYLEKDMNILHREEMESEVMRVLSRNGMIDMTGSLLPGVDGFDTRMNVGIVSLMRQCTAYAVRFSHNSDHWFGPVLEKGFFEENSAD